MVFWVGTVHKQEIALGAQRNRASAPEIPLCFGIFVLSYIQRGVRLSGLYLIVRLWRLGSVR
jgi:hypothetical protein